MSWKNHLQRKYCIAVAVTVFITVTATVWISRNYSFEVFNTTRATDLFIDSSRHNSYQCVGTDCTNHNNRQLKSERQPSPLISRYETKLSTIGNNSSVVLKNKKQKKVLNRWQRDQRYSDQENAIRRSEITWGEFVTLPVQSPRNRITIKTAILNSLNVCPASSTALNSDMPVCTNDVSIEIVFL